MLHKDVITSDPEAIKATIREKIERIRKEHPLEAQASYTEEQKKDTTQEIIGNEGVFGK